MLVFSTDYSDHIRLGNSLVWMSKFSGLINDQEFIYPWARERLSNYLSNDSIWIKNNKPTDHKLSKLIGSNISSASICNYSMNIESKLGYKNWQGRWDGGRIYYCESGLHYITGSVPFDELHSIVNDFPNDIIFVHEPYCITKTSPKFDYSNVYPQNNLIESAKEYISNINKENRIISAVHIRRGDYKRWQNGKHYYNDDFWVDLVSSLNLAGHLVLVFSNDLSNILMNRLINLGATISKGSAEEEFVRLMLVNNIYGPPSTYTQVAVSISESLFGNYVCLNFLGAHE